jgi:hypothetical protein
MLSEILLESGYDRVEPGERRDLKRMLNAGAGSSSLAVSLMP